MMKSIHRKGAKNAKCLFIFVIDFLCDLCVSAVKTVFMDEHLLIRFFVFFASLR